MQQPQHVKNFNHASSEPICKAVYPGIYCCHCTTPDELGNTWHVTTDEFWNRGMVLGRGQTVEEAWAAANERYKDNIWERIRGGHHTRDVALGGEREMEPPPSFHEGK